MRREAEEFVFHEIAPENRFKSQDRLDAEYEIWLARQIESFVTPEEPECPEENPQESK